MVWKSPSTERSSPMTSTPTTEVFLVTTFSCITCEREGFIVGVYSTSKKARKAAEFYNDGLDVDCNGVAWVSARLTVDAPFDDQD